MELDLSTYFSEAFKIYKNPSQIARNVTEKWASHNIYCPRCGLPLQSYGNNTKVNDFYCNHYEQDFQVLPIPSKDNFQLKSTKSFPHNHFPSIITGILHISGILSNKILAPTQSALLAVLVSGTLLIILLLVTDNR